MTIICEHGYGSSHYLSSTFKPIGAHTWKHMHNTTSSSSLLILKSKLHLILEKKFDFDLSMHKVVQLCPKTLLQPFWDHVHRT